MKVTILSVISISWYNVGCDVGNGDDGHGDNVVTMTMSMMSLMMMMMMMSLMMMMMMMMMTTTMNQVDMCLMLITCVFNSFEVKIGMF